MLQDNILNKGASFIKTIPTKVYDKKENTFIDHLITNRPHKILSHQVLKYNFSDHLMVKFTISNKSLIHQPKYRLVRKFSNINWDRVNYEISEDPRIQLASVSTDVNMICDNIMDTISEKLDNQEPTKRIQVNEKLPETKRAHEQRRSETEYTK